MKLRRQRFLSHSEAAVEESFCPSLYCDMKPSNFIGSGSETNVNEKTIPVFCCSSGMLQSSIDYQFYKTNTLLDVSKVRPKLQNKEKNRNGSEER